MVTGLLVGLLAGAGLVGALAWWSRRSATRRLAELTRRLDPDGVSPRRFSDSLVQIERVSERARRERTAVERRVDGLWAALEAMPLPLHCRLGDDDVVFVNRAARQADTGDHVSALVTAAVEEVLDDASAGRPGRRQLDIYGPPARLLVIEGILLTATETPLGGLAVVHDVTTLARLDEVRRDFVANLSHELKTPVGAVSLLAETLLGEDDPAIRERLLERIDTEAQRTARIIDELLALSALEFGDELVLAPVSLARVVEVASERVRDLSDRRDSQVVADPELERWWVHADHGQLVRAVVNLLENAIKYSEQGAIVRVEVAAPVDGFVDLTVIDRGIGIPNRDLERIFERFYRVDRARSRASGGTGLGLAIVRHVAVGHGGEVFVESREGEGSSFTLRLPRAPDHLSREEVS